MTRMGNKERASAFRRFPNGYRRNVCGSTTGIHCSPRRGYYTVDPLRDGLRAAIGEHG
jgi:hypothetical protein